MDNSNRLFRKVVFGGFNKDDVIDYVERMKNEFYEYRKQVEATISELNKKIGELESAASAKAPDSSFDEISADTSVPVESPFDGSVSFSVDEINAATDHLKQTADKLCESLTQFMDKISASCISVTVEAPIQTNSQQSDALPGEEETGKTDEKASYNKITDAYCRALKMKGDSILTSAFSGETSAGHSSETAGSGDSSFSELLDSILNGQEYEAAEKDTNSASDSEKSILDTILSSSAFLN